MWWVDLLWWREVVCECGVWWWCGRGLLWCGVVELVVIGYWGMDEWCVCFFWGYEVKDFVKFLIFVGFFWIWVFLCWLLVYCGVWLIMCWVGRCWSGCWVLCVYRLMGYLYEEWCLCWMCWICCFLVGYGGYGLWWFCLVLV